MRRIVAYWHGHRKELTTAWLPFAAVWLWAIRINPLTQVPAYGDLLEVIWGFDWYADSIRHWHTPLFYGQLFWPEGWSTALLAHTPLLLLVMGAARLLLGPAMVYNLFSFLAFVVCYAGMRRLLSLYVDRRWIVILVALMYTFWGMRWLRLNGHMNVNWLSALLPWLAWVLQADLPRRRRILGAALLWSLGITVSLYGIWLGAAVVAAWLLAAPQRRRLQEVVLLGLLTLVLSAPTTVTFWLAQRATGAHFYDMEHIAYWGASWNSLPVSIIFHPWLQAWTKLIYPGPYNEAGVLNFGSVAVLSGLAGLVGLRLRNVRHRTVVLLAGIGVVMALGPILRYNGDVVRVPWFDGIDAGLWQLGHWLKPALFEMPRRYSFVDAVPLPGWLFYALVPFAEGARVVSRFGFVAAMGFFPLVALGLARIPQVGVRGMVALLLLVEATPWPITQGVPLPPAPHPAFTWLQKQAPGETGAVLDLHLHDTRDHLSLFIAGETLYATSFHGKPTVSGVGSQWSTPTWFWLDWLANHPTPLDDVEFPELLRAFQVRWILVHMREEESWPYISGPFDPELALVRCFDPPAAPTSWDYPICVFQVKTPGPRLAGVAGEGWSGPEAWGRWSEGTDATVRWVAPLVQGYRVRVEAFPNCVAGRQQTASLAVGGTPIGVLRFDDCQPQTGEFTIPSSLVAVGWNTLSFHFGYALAPYVTTAGENPDNRPLAVGFTALEIQPLAR